MVETGGQKRGGESGLASAGESQRWTLTNEGPQIAQKLKWGSAPFCQKKKKKNQLGIIGIKNDSTAFGSRWVVERTLVKLS